MIVQTSFKWAKRFSYPVSLPRRPPLGTSKHTFVFNSLGMTAQTKACEMRKTSKTRPFSLVLSSSAHVSDRQSENQRGHWHVVARDAPVPCRNQKVCFRSFALNLPLTLSPKPKLGHTSYRHRLWPLPHYLPKYASASL